MGTLSNQSCYQSNFNFCNGYNFLRYIFTKIAKYQYFVHLRPYHLSLTKQSMDILLHKKGFLSGNTCKIIQFLRKSLLITCSFTVIDLELGILPTTCNRFHNWFAMLRYWNNSEFLEHHKYTSLHNRLRNQGYEEMRLKRSHTKFRHQSLVEKCEVSSKMIIVYLLIVICADVTADLSIMKQ